MTQLVNDNYHQISARLIHLILKVNSCPNRDPHPSLEKTKPKIAEEQQLSTKNMTQPLPHLPVLPSFVHVFMLLHHDRVSC